MDYGSFQHTLPPTLKKKIKKSNRLASIILYFFYLKFFVSTDINDAICNYTIKHAPKRPCLRIFCFVETMFLNLMISALKSISKFFVYTCIH